jgi:hypothetical protein
VRSVLLLLAVLAFSGCVSWTEPPGAVFASSGQGGLGGCTPQAYLGVTAMMGAEFGFTSCACGTQSVSDGSPAVKAWALNETPNACETSCSSSADCPDPRTSCQSGSCRLNSCSLGSSGASVPCDASGSDHDDGACIPYNGVGGSQGLCVLGGTAGAGQACSYFALRATPATLCTPGLICVPSNGVTCAVNPGTGVCHAACAIGGSCGESDRVACLSADAVGCFNIPAPYYCPADGG